VRVEPIWVRVWVETLGTSVADKGSFISRFLYKALEIIGAAVATAVSGYLVAHMGGFLPSQTHAPTPPSVAVAPAPSERSVVKNSPANVPAKEPAATAQPTQSAATPPAAEGPDRRAAQTPPEATTPAAQSAPKSSKTKTAVTPPPRGKSAKEAAATPDAGRPRETPEAKPREVEDKESVEARVKAALAKVDANRQSPADPRHGDVLPATQPQAGDVTPNTTAAIPPRPLESPSAATAPAGQPRSADLGTPVQQSATQPASSQSPAAQSAPSVAAPVQIAPVQTAAPQQPDALTSVEIKSRPIATIDTPSAPQAAPPQEEEKGVTSFFQRILPDLRRPASAGADAPRPPASVGE
jgi:hypothetical protein